MIRSTGSLDQETEVLHVGHIVVRRDRFFREAMASRIYATGRSRGVLYTVWSASSCVVSVVDGGDDLSFNLFNCDVEGMTARLFRAAWHDIEQLRA